MTVVTNSSQLIDVLLQKGIEDVGVLIYKALDSQPANTLRRKLANIDRLKAWLDSFRPLDPSMVQEMKKFYDVNFTYNSNAIEGNTLSLSETELVLEKGITIGGKSLREHLEVVGHKEAIDFIEDLANTDSEISEREIKDIHSLIMRHIDINESGKYRNLDVRAAGTNHVYPAHYKVQDLMDQFLSWLNSDEVKQLHPIDYATQAHFKLAAIHPFKDGNGRTSRLLMNLILLKQGYPIAVITNDKRKDYIDSLVYAEEHSGDTDKFLGIVAESVKHSLIDFLKVASTMTGKQGSGELFYSEIQTVLNTDLL